MTEKEYVVVVNAGVDLEAFDAELAASTGEGPIPNRAVDIANPRIGSKRMTHWMLTDAEANTLMSDPRVLSVEIPADQRTDISIGLRAFQGDDFTKPSGLDPSVVNWGLRRCIESTNNYSNNSSATGQYEYALDGTGVDIVIQDSGLQVDHPEFAGRVQQIDWYAESGLPGTQNANHYRDLDGHGTHCAGIAAGKTYGWAKNAHVYSQKLAGLEGSGDSGTGISITDAFDTIRLWHAAKTNGRPTVVNMSWGYSSTVSGNPTGGTYRGVPWVWNVDYNNDTFLWQGTGIVPAVFGPARVYPARVASVDAEIDDMVAAGIHVFIAAGNDLYKGDDVGGLDYDNSVIYGGTTLYYHRGSSPHSDNAMCIGNIDSAVQLDGGIYKDKTANTTSRGPRVDIFAPGTNIISTLSNSSIYSTGDYPDNTSFNVGNLSGTSMASPQVAGVCALHLQVNPQMTPAQFKSRIQNDSYNVMFETGLDNDYSVYQSSLMGAPNRVLYSRYGTQPLVQKNIVTNVGT